MELPARFVRDYLGAARELGIAPEPLLAGLAIDATKLDDLTGRVRWNDFAELSERIGSALGTAERVEELGRLSVALSSPWAFRHLVPRFVTPAVLLRIGLQFTGPAVFPNLRHALERRPNGTLRLTLSVPAPYRGCETFFRACVGGVRSIPTLFGYEPALLVVVSLGPRGCIFEVTPPPGRTLVGRFRSALRALRGDSVLFDEVARQHESMQGVFRALLRTQSELHQLMERVPDPLVVQRDGIVLWTNQAFLAAVKAASLDELQGRPFVDLVHPSDRAAAAVRVGAPIATLKSETLRIQATDGSFRTFELSEPQDVIFEEIPARMELARDVTERNALREQLVLADRMSQLGFLAAGVAHEINNPLAYALAALDRARSDMVAGHLDAAVASLVLAREGGERVRGITNDLRMFARGGDHQAEAVDLVNVLRATADLAAANIRTRGRLILQLGPTPVVFADAGKLGQVFMNLLVNAIDAIAEGNPATSQITVRAGTDKSGAAIVEVEDNGHGVPRDVQARIFEPFFTTKGPRSGSGLGLAICHRIVTDLGGRIEAATPAGAGALFRVVLPPHDGAVQSPASGPRSTQRLRILVIDDEPPLANALGRMLEDDHDVDVVTSGEGAFDRLASATYDAILCDLMMADVGGMDVYATSRRPLPRARKAARLHDGGCVQRRRPAVPRAR
jgi:PAS domain S-box-containing protein